jgi:hypothetical protein
MQISVIIAHYAPEESYRRVLIQTIQSIRNQDYSGRVEIAICDDGSHWSRSLLQGESTKGVFERSEIEQEPLLQDLDIDWYLVGRRTSQYNKAVLWNLAADLVQSDALVFLDDDHPFLRQDSITSYAKYLQKYEFVIGRIQNRGGVFRLFRDGQVQGSNFGIKKSLLNDIGRFNEATSLWGAGEDSDLFWKVYSKIGRQNRQHKQACYAGDIVTADLCSYRWASCTGNMDTFIKGFMNLYGVHPLENPCRSKKEWVEHTSAHPFLTESWYRLKNAQCVLRDKLGEMFSAPKDNK